MLSQEPEFLTGGGVSCTQGLQNQWGMSTQCCDLRTVTYFYTAAVTKNAKIRP